MEGPLPGTGRTDIAILRKCVISSLGSMRQGTHQDCLQMHGKPVCHQAREASLWASRDRREGLVLAVEKTTLGRQLQFWGSQDRVIE